MEDAAVIGQNLANNMVLLNNIVLTTANLVLHQHIAGEPVVDIVAACRSGANTIASA